jgi:FkbM family methyltransferase
MAIVTFESDPPAIWNLYSTIHGDLGFDIGANGGMTVRLLAPNFERIIAYEPAAESWGPLNDCPDNCEPVLAAVTDQVGEVTLDIRAVTAKMGELTTGNSMPAQWGEYVGERTVRAVTIDSEAERVGDPDFIKVDTEGHEAHIIRGGIETIRRCDPRLLIEVHSAENGEEIIDLLKGRITKVCHPFYAPGSDMWKTHYYILRGLTT